MVKRKARLAEAVLANGSQLPEQADADVLQAYADARAMSLAEAANEILYKLDASERLLEDTEKAKDRMLARIAAITTQRDIKRVASEIDAL